VGWFQNHLNKCPTKQQTKGRIVQTKELKFPECYVWIEYLELPEEKEFKKGKTINLKDIKNSLQMEEEETDHETMRNFPL